MSLEQAQQIIRSVIQFHEMPEDWDFVVALNTNPVDGALHVYHKAKMEFNVHAFMEAVSKLKDKVDPSVLLMFQTILVGLLKKG